MKSSNIMRLTKNSFSSMALCALSVLAPAAYAAQLIDETGEHRLLSSAFSITVGDSMSNVVQKLEPPWAPVYTNSYLDRYPYRELMPQSTNSLVVSEWRSEGMDRRSGLPMVLFVMFSDAAKTNVVDVLYSDGRSVQPFVHGVYDRNLSNISVGDSIQKVYSLLGKRNCEYSLGKNGNWEVKLVYMGAEGKFIAIWADAGTGSISTIKDVTLD